MPSTNAAENQLPDATFVGKVRRILRDNGVWVPDKFQTDGITGVLTAGAKPFKLTRPPVLTAFPVALTAPGGNYAATLLSYLPAFDTPLSAATVAPTIADSGDALGTLPAGEYQVFWTLSNGGASAAAASQASPLSNKVTILVNHRLIVTNLPNPIPAGGINLYIVPLATGGPNSQGFALYIAAAAAGPYVIANAGNGISPVFIDSDTGEATFAAPPASGTLAVTYKSSRFSDQQVLDALTEGMHLLWPEIWNPKTNSTQIGLSPTSYEYALQALFQNQRAVILDVEYSPPSGTLRYYRTSLWRQLEDINNPTLVFSDLPPISSVVRITYTQPFQSLGEVPVECQHLPVYFAVAKLLMDQEVMRTRADDIQALAPGENAAQAGASLSAAAYWMDRFSQDLKKLAIEYPARRSIEDRTVEALGLSAFWTHNG